ncbi:MAG TPA: hypothetical protein VK178_18105 [Opitutaceae bacterium]|nr:hypothetical protein [Opitutaceae bacterium]
MSRLSTQSVTASQLRSRLVFASCTLLLGIVAGLCLQHAQRKSELLDLERQFALAQRAADSAAVGEIARRLVRLDHSPERLLAVATGQLQARRFDELESTLAQLEHDTPYHRPSVLRLRARAATAQADWDTAIALWETYLADCAATPADRVAALDELTALLVNREKWLRARDRIDERLGFADAPAARLVRAHIALRQHDWAVVQADFQHLRTHAAAAPGVKEFLPAWERVERALTHLHSSDTALATAPHDLRLRLERALLSARLGLWQNAGDDLRQAAESAPGARMPVLFAATLGLPPSFADRRPTADPEPLAALPWLASSTALAAYSDARGAQLEDWRRLAALEAQIADQDSARRLSVDDLPALRVERAELLYSLGHAEAAVQEARTLLKAQPQLVAAQRVLTLALLATGEIAEASRALDQLTSALTAADITEYPELSRLTGLVRQAQGRHAEAVDALSSFLLQQSDTTRPEILRARATSLRHLQRFAEATQDLATAQRLEAAATTEDAS